MAVVDDDGAVGGAQALEFGPQRCMVRIEPAGASLGDGGQVRLGAGTVQRLAVEGHGRTKLRRRLSGVERCA